MMMDPTLSSANCESVPTSIHVECIDYLADIDLLIQDHWEWIFGEQLGGWVLDSTLWPSDLSLEMFHIWFDHEFSSSIWDMLKPRIKASFSFGRKMVRANGFADVWPNIDTLRE